jgi:hypothetical protein
MVGQTIGQYQTEAQVYGPDGNRLCSNWQYAGQTLDLECQLKLAGTHTLLVGGHESSGAYTLAPNVSTKEAPVNCQLAITIARQPQYAGERPTGDGQNPHRPFDAGHLPSPNP